MPTTELSSHEDFIQQVQAKSLEFIFYMSIKTTFASSLTVGMLAVGGVAAVEVSQAEPSEAAVCGYSTKMEDYESMFHLDLPVIGEVDPFGGKREVAYYGNCGSSNQKITVKSQDGNYSLCVTPGETKIGFTQHDRKITGASKAGTC